MLVGLGVAAEWLLASMTSRSNGIVAAFLVVLVTAFGPVVDRRATSKAIPATGPAAVLDGPAVSTRKD